MRQGEEDDVVSGQGLDRGRLHEPVGQRDQVRLGVTEAAADTGVPVTAPIFTSGCVSSSRNSSPPAYPVAPATATLIDTCMNMPLTARLCKLFRQWRSPKGPDRSRDSRRY